MAFNKKVSTQLIARLLIYETRNDLWIRIIFKMSALGFGLLNYK